MNTKTFTVTGMTCGHCEMSVREEVSELPGLQNIEVDRNRQFLSVSSEQEIDSDAVIAAVSEAGFSATAN